MFDRNLSIDTVEGVREMHGSRLRSLVGQSIDAVWVAWEDLRDEWFASEAVIIQAGSTSLEVVCWGLSDILISWNAIDRSLPPATMADWGSEFKLRWRRDAIASVRTALGKPIVAVNLIEYHFRTVVIDDRRDEANIGREDEAWVLIGIELELPGSVLFVFNALDENGLTDERPTGEEYRRTPV
jgi:hypothetical protein